MGSGEVRHIGRGKTRRSGWPGGVLSASQHAALVERVSNRIGCAYCCAAIRLLAGACIPIYGHIALALEPLDMAQKPLARVHRRSGVFRRRHRQRRIVDQRLFDGSFSERGPFRSCQRRRHGVHTEPAASFVVAHFDRSRHHNFSGLPQGPPHERGSDGRESRLVRYRADYALRSGCGPRSSHSCFGRPSLDGCYNFLDRCRCVNDCWNYSWHVVLQPTRCFRRRTYPSIGPAGLSPTYSPTKLQAVPPALA
jgi:hypothetical protein